MLQTGQKGNQSAMTITERLDELGIKLPGPAAAVGAYVATVRVGDMVFVSGQLPSRRGEVVFSGKVGGEIDLDAAQQAARLAAINGLAAVNEELGSLEEVERIVRVEVFVNSAKGFTDQAKVANGASLLLGDVFGPVGQHVRLAVGVAELPLDAAVEVAMIVKAK